MDHSWQRAAVDYSVPVPTIRLIFTSTSQALGRAAPKAFKDLFVRHVIHLHGSADQRHIFTLLAMAPERLPVCHPETGPGSSLHPGLVRPAGMHIDRTNKRHVDTCVTTIAIRVLEKFYYS
jgi:hypothetical protein